MFRVAFAFFLIPLFFEFCCPVNIGQDKAQKSEEEAVWQFANQVLEVLKKEDLPALMKMNDTPWWKDGQLIKKEEVLKQWWRKRFDYKLFPLKDEPMKINRIYRYAQARKTFNEDSQKSLDTIMTKDDYVIFVQYRKAFLFLMIAQRGDQLKVVGSTF